MRSSLFVALVLGCQAPAPAPAPVVTPTPARPLAPDPGDPAATRAWLQSFAYRTWTPMSELRTTGEHGGERLFFNQTLAASWQARAAEHPIGSAAVRELWSADLSTIKGFAFMVKTGPSGDLGEGWYWYEVFGTTEDARPTVAEAGARGCVGCHAHAVDFVHDPATPREDPQPLL